jgi:DNA topoisomerase I
VAAIAIAAGVEVARRAQLRWVSDVAPGITRRRHGRSFAYTRANGSVVRDHATLQRISSVAVPPAWTDVWICADPNGHIQATGRDMRRRKQYRYHPHWCEVRDEAKYDRVIEFGKALPRIRSRVNTDLARRALTRERVLAATVRLLDLTLARVGNAEYAKANGSYGLTTMRARHIDIDGERIRLNFRGKGGKRVTADVRDRRVATVLQRCTTLPGEELFQYVDEHDDVHTVTSDDVNAYLREISGSEFTAKDFRTWAGTVTTACALRELGTFNSVREAKRQVRQAIERAAGQLGNTAAICRRCYVHPQVLDAYMDGSLLKARFRRGAEERAVLRLLGA